MEELQERMVNRGMVVLLPMGVEQLAMKGSGVMVHGSGGEQLRELHRDSCTDLVGRPAFQVV